MTSELLMESCKYLFWESGPLYILNQILIGPYICCWITTLPAEPVISCYCCKCCITCTAEFCCDIGHPGYFTFPHAAPNDKPIHVTKWHMPKECARGPAEKSLHVAIVNLQCNVASEILPDQSFITPQSLMSTTLLDHIVDLVHNQALKFGGNLNKQITWAFLNTYGMKSSILFTNSAHSTFYLGTFMTSSKCSC